jgi:F-type H+-transporting ATPase subunit epsilon
MGGGVGMSSIEGFIKEIEWFDNMMYDYNGDYRGICKWECREGLFEILDKHAPLVSALGKGQVKVLMTASKSESYIIKSGFVEVVNNKTTVLVEGVA